MVVKRGGEGGEEERQGNVRDERREAGREGGEGSKK